MAIAEYFRQYEGAGILERSPLKDKEIVSPIYVMKFGGASVGSVEAIEEVVEFIDYHRKDGKMMTIVVSAMSGVTDGLSCVCDALEVKDREKAKGIVDGIRERHMTVINRFNMPTLCKYDLMEELDGVFSDIYEDLDIEGEISDQQKAKILAFGERPSTRLLEGRLRLILNRTIVVDSSEIIQTDEQFLSASVDKEATSRKVREKIGSLLKRGYTPFITGFFGATRNGEITTLGRNSSDYSATTVGVPLGAKEIWLCKRGVNGVYTSDPKIDDQAVHITSMSYNVALAMAQKGNKVIHAKTLEPLIGENIVLIVRNSSDPRHLGTRVMPFIEGQEGVK